MARISNFLALFLVLLVERVLYAFNSSHFYVD